MILAVNQLPTMVKSNRLISLDALRGFNMFWIIGADQIGNALKSLSFPGARFLAGQLRHPDWNGFTFYDQIFPMFIFVVGVSATLSISSRLRKGKTKLQILKHILTRTVLLFLLGVILSNSGLDLYGWLTNIRWMGVLQRIALCYFGTSLLALYTKPRAQAIIAGIILIGYYLLLRFVPVPGYGPGVWDPPTANFANYFDSLFLPGRLYYGTWDVEGLLSTFPAVASCLLGALAGYWLRGEWLIKGNAATKEQKTVILGLIGLGLTGLGLLWGLDFPINKKIWTSSYTLLTGGLSAVGLALFYWLIDIRGYQKWAFPFVVIGLNSIFIYLAATIIPFDAVSRWLTGRDILNLLGATAPLFLTGITLLVEWSILYLMYQRKLFLRL